MYYYICKLCFLQCTLKSLNKIMRKLSYTNCTVSVNKTFSLLGRIRYPRLKDIKRGKQLILRKHTCVCKRVLRSVDLPALVYPTIAAIGVPLFALFFLIMSLCDFTSSNSFESFAILSLIILLSSLQFSSTRSPGTDSTTS